jgi:hypothetical protein
MYRRVLFAASLGLASNAQAQTPQSVIMRHIAPAGTPSGAATMLVDSAPAVRITGDRALQGQVEYRPRATAPASFSDTPIDGSRALMGHWPSAWQVGGGRTERQSFFRAELRGEVTRTAWGEGEFGAVLNPDRSSGAFVISLGVCSPQGAILFTRRSTTPLAPGRYRISERANEPDEILALILTGSSSRPTGAFHGQSGWLVVTATSDQFIAGRFELDATGFVAAEPEKEDRPVNVTGSFSATAASSSFRVCEDAE